MLGWNVLLQERGGMHALGKGLPSALAQVLAPIYHVNMQTPLLK